jgi:predicted nucleic acid-binding protein
VSLTAIYDACILYPASLRDFLMWLALTDLFKAKWTEEIHAEWMRNVLKNRPDLTLEQLTRTKNLMNANVRDCLVTGYESLITTINLPDPGDRHVLAAAIHSQANIIVTFNLSDFPAKALQPYGVEAVHPDEFIQDLIDLDTKAVGTAAQKQRQTLKNPPKTSDEYLDTLLNTGLKQTVATLKLLCVEI